MTDTRVAPVREILFATDFSEPSEAAARVAAGYARQFGARVHVLHVAWPGEAHVTPLLTGLAEALSPVVPAVTVVERGDPARHIVDYARRKRIDLVVVGTHGRTGVSRALLGSVAERVVRTAPCPVLAVPAAEPTAGTEAEPAAAVPHRGLVCSGVSEDLICETCRARIRGEALERKQREERAGRA